MKSSKERTKIDYESLPEEVRKELAGWRRQQKNKGNEESILEVLNRLEGIANLNELLFFLYQWKQKVFKRQKLTMKLYKMKQKGLVFASSKKDGVYSTSEELMGTWNKCKGQRSLDCLEHGGD